MFKREKALLTHILLSDVDALASHRQGDVDPVVDQQRDAVAAANVVQPLRAGDEGARVGGLLAVLNDGDAALHGGLDDGGQVLVAEDGRRRVGHEVEGVVYGWLAHCGGGGCTTNLGIEIRKEGLGQRSQWVYEEENEGCRKV